MVNPTQQSAIERFRSDFQVVVLQMMHRENISYRAMEKRTGISKYLIKQYLTTHDCNPDLETLIKLFDAVGYIARITLIPVELEDIANG